MTNLFGGSGEDDIRAGNGMDFLCDGDDDPVNGGNSCINDTDSDKLDGGGGNDTIEAVGGDDTWNGGRGNDTCPTLGSAEADNEVSCNP